MSEPGDTTVQGEASASRGLTLRATLLLVGVVVGVGITLGLVMTAKALLDPRIPEATGAPHFVEETTAAGIDQVYDGDLTFFVGGGVAAFDCNEDKKPDLYLAGGTNPAGLFVNESEPGGPLSFSRSDDQASELSDVTGAYPIDIDSDGLVDLAVLRLGENVILRGLGDCRFETANRAWGVDGGQQWTAAFSAEWEGSNTLPTLAFGNYVNVDERAHATEGCSDNYLIRPSGPDAYQEPTPLTPGWCTLSILFSDWDRSGRRDLRMTNDRHYYRDGEEQLWRVETGAQPRLYTGDDGWQEMQIWGMGIASQDLTGDGRPEVFLTSQGDNKLQTLSDDGGRPDYVDIALARGVTAPRPFVGDTVHPSTAWHAEFEDVNNDGYMDLYVTKGNVEAMPEFAAEDPNNLLLGQADGTFEESADTAGVLDVGRTRGAALVDFNLDGRLDLIDVNRRENVRVWRNTGLAAEDGRPAGNWLAVELTQHGANRDAIGSWVEVDMGGGRTVQREVTIGGGHAGGQLGWIHFGIGDADTARIRVQWPDGELSPWMRVDANQFFVVKRDETQPNPWQPLPN
ncbi:MAG: CRTAC1 family protein [Acidimicrobiia bacterium]